ncbi:MAG: hypothetical protein ACXWP4_25835, partial [Polyangiales bacterium]
MTGLVCLEATGKDMLGASGPAGGYCSKDCLSYVKGDVDLDPCLAIGGRCYGKKSDASAWCLEACAFGAAEAGVKCHGREDVGCTAAIDRTGAKTTNAYCEPICGAKSDCGGRVCDEGTSRCVDKGGEHPGDPDGTASAGSTATTCAGFNVPVAVAADGGTTTVYVCGARCVWGDAAQSCGANGACLYSPSSRGPG